MENLYSTIKEIKNIPLSLVIEQCGVKLNKGKCCCPFHNEKTPSFVVSDRKAIFKCFGCGVYGDAINFVKEFYQLSTEEAVLLIAKNNGLKYTPDTQADDNEKNSLYQLNKLVMEAYQQNLRCNGNFITYLQEKGVSVDTIDKWKLGFAPKQALFIEAALQKKGATLGKYKSTFIKGQFDRLIYRLVVPLLSPRGEVVGFSGRTLLPNNIAKEKEVAKWVNSQDSEVYSKQAYIFGMNHAKKPIRQQGSAVIVEGYFDCILMHQHGIRNVVAIGGTSLTESQCRLLGYTCKNVVIMLDGDEAGRKATLRSIDVAINANLAVKVVTLPLEDDPDSFIRKYGAVKLSALIANADDAIVFKYNSIKRDFANNLGEVKNAVLEWINGIKAHDVQHDIAHRIASLIGYNEISTNDFLKSIKKSPPQPTLTLPVDTDNNTTPIIMKYLLLYGDIMMDNEFSISVMICKYTIDHNIIFTNERDILILNKHVELLKLGIIPTIHDLLGISSEISNYITTIGVTDPQSEEETDPQIAVQLVVGYISRQIAEKKQHTIQSLCDAISNARDLTEQKRYLDELSYY